MSSEVILSVSVLLNALMLVLVVFLVYKNNQVLSEFEPFLTESEKMKHVVAKKANEVLAKTITLAQDLVRNSVDESSRNIKISESFRKELENVLKNEIQQTVLESKQIIQNETKDIIGASENVLALLNNQLQAFPAEIKKQISEVTLARIDELAQGYSKAMEDIPKVVEGRLEESITTTNAAIEQYKKQRITQVDAQIYQVIAAVAKKVMGKTINLADHEDMVMAALEKAKKENLL